ncbi:uncharacterized protein B0I36DRAFT_326439 [Microdochium trichocladiopsis]|uniref:Uncharacterized protein n=1 Tax=Microdochium trichocladiopsis TaxID=1682393 RepID=A0A9P8Y813_9PEZI|nr:uncharacterized protein B0I36DRAFT_326439 [Microdochium trichocladiopsis]KAH7029871.1 hypothetical protein B0I36DRAFT_326439 [Microdochium trichocladiopsis]
MTGSYSTPQTTHTELTRSSTMVSECSTTQAVHPGYCPTPQPANEYRASPQQAEHRQSVSSASFAMPPPPPPPAQSAAIPQQAATAPITTMASATSYYATASGQTSPPVGVTNVESQYTPIYATPAPAVPVSNAAATPPHPQFAPVQAYNPAAVAIQQPYIPSPSQGPMTPQQQQPAAMYFAPPPEQASITTGPKGKRMSMLSAATGKLASAISNVKQNVGQPQQEQHHISAYNPADPVHTMPQATPKQQGYAYGQGYAQHNANLQQTQYINNLQKQQQQQQQQQSAPYVPAFQPVASAPFPAQQLPPTPISPPFSPPLSYSQSPSPQHQPYPVQQLQPQNTGYFPPVAPSPHPQQHSAYQNSPPPPQNQQYQNQQYQQQYPPQKIPGAYTISGGGYYPPAGVVGQPMPMTPMATPSGP